MTIYDLFTCIVLALCLDRWKSCGGANPVWLVLRSVGLVPGLCPMMYLHPVEVSVEFSLEIEWIFALN